jgi:hypothetical protein
VVILVGGTRDTECTKNKNSAKTTIERYLTWWLSFSVETPVDQPNEDECCFCTIPQTSLPNMGTMQSFLPPPTAHKTIPENRGGERFQIEKINNKTIGARLTLMSDINLFVNNSIFFFNFFEHVSPSTTSAGCFNPPLNVKFTVCLYNTIGT